ncbi:hypothetical protein [Marinobacterium sp. MBR-109]|uniref:hypothetical protein n=1 Tax=Marinobacterium sp. MBR-109 TaxID=3156462 RepID=UPI00339A7351
MRIHATGKPSDKLKKAGSAIADTAESVNERVMHQLRSNSPNQAFLGDFPQAVDDAVMSSSEAHQNQMLQILSNPQVAQGFARVVFDMLLNKYN